MKFHSSSIIGRGTRSLAVVMGALIVLSASLPTVLAAETHYTDVPSGSYYEDAAAALLDAGALDRSELRLRPSDLAQRAELVKIMVNLQDTTLLYPASSSFSDVSRSAWYAPYMEAAAKAGWVKGDDNCYQVRTPCVARPAGLINRAEAAALLVRTFALERTGAAPDFMDVPSYEWYYPFIQAAADHCVLQGDSGTGLVRPGSYMNRAEMVVMFNRAYEHLTYGTDCGTVADRPTISSVSAISSTRVRVTFNMAINANRMEDDSRYSIRRVSDNSIIDIGAADQVSDRIVDLDLDDTLATNVEYTLAVTNMLSTQNVQFSDTERFTLTGVAGDLTSVTALAANKVRLTFNGNLDRARAEDELRYTFARTSGTGQIVVQNAILLSDNRTVELTLAGNVTSNVPYTVAVGNVMTDAGVVFSDTGTVTYNTSNARITSVEVVSSLRLRVTFDTDLDDIRAEEKSRYIVSDGTHNLTINSANIISNRVVELTLGESLQSQRNYTVTVTNLLTDPGVAFSGTGAVINNGSSVLFTAALNGSKQVPAVTTAATGTGTFTLTNAGLQYDITIRNLSGSAVTAAHFHQGATGATGPVISPVISFNSAGRATGTWTNLTTEQRNWLLSNSVYFNVHTAANPNGEIRGQVTVTQ